MEDTKTTFEKLFNESISKALEVYDSFKEYFEPDNVDIQQINSFETFWKNNSGISINVFPKYREKVNRDIEAQLNSLASTAIKDVPAEILQYYNIQEGLKSLYHPIILVHWKEVTVTNEHDRSIVIQELYARTEITLDGKIAGKPKFQRTTYTQEQWVSNYMHSHIDSIYKSTLNAWRDSCLGTGPIRDTIAKLTQFCDKNYWDLYCLELDKYVHVESLDGTPYRYLEDVGTRNPYDYSEDYSAPKGYVNWDEITRITATYPIMPKQAWNEFFEYLINTSDFKFHFTNQYYLAMTYPKFVVYVSNKFIDWFNEKFKNDKTKTLQNLLNTRVLAQGLWSNHHLLQLEENPRNGDFDAFEQKYTNLVEFKKQTIGLKIIRATSENTNKVILLNRYVISYLYYKIIEIVNNEQRTEYKRKG